MDSFYPIKHWLLTLLLGAPGMAGYELTFYNANNSGGFPEYFALYFLLGYFFRFLFCSYPISYIYY